MKRQLSLTRALVDKLPSSVDHQGPIRVHPPAPNYYETTADAILSVLGPDKPLWVFAAGSLIWNPRFETAERRAALVKGWRRAFCLGPDTRRRGNPDNPGLMLSLDKGGECPGVVIRMIDGDRHTALVGLLKTEPPVPPSWVTAETEPGPVDAIAFTAAPDFLMYTPEPPEEVVADTLASAVGKTGSMADYLLNTVTELEKARVHDPYIWRMQELVAERLMKLP